MIVDFHNFETNSKHVKGNLIGLIQGKEKITTHQYLGEYADSEKEIFLIEKQTKVIIGVLEDVHKSKMGRTQN